MKALLLTFVLLIVPVLTTPERSCAFEQASSWFTATSLRETEKITNGEGALSFIRGLSTDLQIKTGLTRSDRNQHPESDLIQKFFWVVLILSFFILCWALSMRFNRRKLLRQEKKFHDLFELSQDGVLLRRLDAEVFYDCNQAMLEMLGYNDKEEFLTLGPKGIVFQKQPDGKVIEDHLKVASEILQEKKKNRFEGLFKRKDGSAMYAEVVACLVDINGKPTIQSVIRDMTERKMMEDNLRKLSSAVEASSASILITDSDGNVEYVNPKFTELTGYSLAEVEGLNPRFLKSGEHDQQYYQKLWDTILAGKDWHGTFLNKKKNGEEYWAKASISSVIDEQKQITHFVGIQDDITEMKRMEAELLEAKQSADDANRAKSDFLARMSHEIRTPMNAVIGMNHLALQTDLTSKQQDYISKAHGAAQSLLGILNDILDFSKIEAGKLEFEHIPFNLEKILDNLASVVSLSAAAKNLELVFMVAPGTPQHLVGDPLRLQQILTNLTNNAIKFTRKGEISISVEPLENQNNNTILLFKVRDSGIGLNEKQVSKLFRSFSQADGSTTREYGGTGLGLVICKRLVEMMQGKIEVTSKPGEGSTFSFTAVFETITGANDPQPVLPDELRGLRVLVVDDSIISRKVLTRFLEQHSLHVETAESGETAVTMMSEATKCFDVVLMDWHMPGIDGIEASRQILSQNHPHQPKIIMITAYGREDIAERAQEVGIMDFLVKPVSSTVLVEALLSAFGCTPEKREEIASTESLTVNLQALGKRSILLVEDNELNIQVANELLNATGLQVTIARNGVEAVELAEEKDFDLILMDIQMPELDGISATRLIRKNNQDIPIIAMSASAMTADKEASIAAGMNDHVTKPVDPSRLYRVLLHHLKNTDLNPETANEPTGNGNGQDVFSKIQGLNSIQGLKHVAGNKDLYAKLLQKFAALQKNTADKIRISLKEQDYETAKRRIHSLKGLCGTIGALNLQNRCEQMETHLQTPKETETFTLLEGFQQELAALIERIQQTIVVTENQHHKDRGDLEILLILIQDLLPAIKKRNPVMCKEVLARMEEYDWPEKVQGHVKNLTGLIRKYRYKEALPLAEEIREACS